MSPRPAFFTSLFRTSLLPNGQNWAVETGYLFIKKKSLNNKFCDRKKDSYWTHTLRDYQTLSLIYTVLDTQNDRIYIVEVLSRA